MSGSDDKGSNDQPSLDKLISLKKAAKLCGLSYSHLRRLARDGDIWGIKPGNTWLTTELAVREYLARDNRPGPKPQTSADQLKD